MWAILPWVLFFLILIWAGVWLYSCGVARFGHGEDSHWLPHACQYERPNIAPMPGPREEQDGEGDFVYKID